MHLCVRAGNVLVCAQIVASTSYVCVQVSAALRTLAGRLEFVRSLSTRCVLRATQQDITRQSRQAEPDFKTHSVYEFECCRSGKQVGLLCAK